MENEVLKIAVMGTGAIGGYYGGRLAAAGNDVTFIARGAQLEALRTNGLKVSSPLGDFTVDPAAATVLAVAQGIRMTGAPKSNGGRIAWG